jgi:hypothetical protein
MRLSAIFMAWSLLALMATSSLGRADSLLILKPKVGDPVLQELMGGCSLRCAFFWETLAGKSVSNLKPASELCDDDAMTAWISPTQGAGEIIQFRIPKRLPKDCRDTPFYGITIANGVIRTLEEFRAYSRVKSMTLSVNKKRIARFHLADTWRWQAFHFEDIMINQGDLIELTIEEITPGKTSQQPGITEIMLQGGH